MYLEVLYANDNKVDMTPVSSGAFFDVRCHGASDSADNSSTKILPTKEQNNQPLTAEKQFLVSGR